LGVCVTIFSQVVVASSHTCKPHVPISSDVIMLVKYEVMLLYFKSLTPFCL
jgi:hypothetical protein